MHNASFPTELTEQDPGQDLHDATRQILRPPRSPRVLGGRYFGIPAILEAGCVFYQRLGWQSVTHVMGWCDMWAPGGAV